MRRVGECAFCRLEVITDDEAQTVAHKDPVCAQFDALARKVGDFETRQVQDEAVGAHLDALAARVRNKSKGEA